MKKIYNFIMTRPIIFLLFAIIILFIPSVISAEPQGFSKLIIRYMAIDKIEDEFEVTVCAYIPRAINKFSENNQIISAKGSSVNRAILNIAKLAGKTVGLAHSNLVLVNDELCEYGLISALDYLVREYSLGNNTFVMGTGDIPAKEVINVANDLAKDKGISILDIIEYDHSHVYSKDLWIEELYNETFSPNKTSIIGKIVIKEDLGIEAKSGGSSEGESGDSGTSGGGSSGGDSSGSSSSGSQKKKLANEGDIIVLKDGKKALDIPYQELFNLNWAQNTKDFGIFELNNYSDNIFTNANLSFFVYQNNVNIKTKFENGKPICEISIKPKLMLNEVNQESINENFYHTTFHLDCEQVFKSINNKISLDLSKALKKTINENIDILDLNELFYTKNTKEFKEFLKTLENSDEYISETEIRIKVDAAIIE